MQQQKCKVLSLGVVAHTCHFSSLRSKAKGLSLNPTCEDPRNTEQNNRVIRLGKFPPGKHYQSRLSSGSCLLSLLCPPGPGCKHVQEPRPAMPEQGAPWLPTWVKALRGKWGSKGCTNERKMVNSKALKWYCSPKFKYRTLMCEKSKG